MDLAETTSEPMKSHLFIDHIIILDYVQSLELFIGLIQTPTVCVQMLLKNKTIKTLYINNYPLIIFFMTFLF